MHQDNGKPNGLEDQLTMKNLGIGLLGISPIPIAGEIALSYFYNVILKDSQIKPVAIPAALLTRIGMYSTIYFPLISIVKEYLS